jgi:hypothetical protein
MNRIVRKVVSQSEGNSYDRLSVSNETTSDGRLLCILYIKRQRRVYLQSSKPLSNSILLYTKLSRFIPPLDDLTETYS